jgi:hypothetical protein
VRLQCPAGRPDTVASYCEKHGGKERARQTAERGWNYVAPESVGDAAAVEDAGCTGLQTTEAYVVIRQAREDQGGVWLAWLGLGSMLKPVENPQPPVRMQADGRPRTRGGLRRRGTGASLCSFPTREAALSTARMLWSKQVQERVQLIRSLRGGTLSWGTPVEPLAEPVVILLEQGDTRSAWDVAERLKARSRAGLAAISGLRPSGECA